MYSLNFNVLYDLALKQIHSTAPPLNGELETLFLSCLSTHHKCFYVQVTLHFKWEFLKTWNLALLITIWRFIYQYSLTHSLTQFYQTSFEGFSLPISFKIFIKKVSICKLSYTLNGNSSKLCMLALLPYENWVMVASI